MCWCSSEACKYEKRNRNGGHDDLAQLQYCLSRTLSVHHATNIPNHSMIPHATPTSNNLHHHHLFVLPVLLHQYHFSI